MAWHSQDGVQQTQWQGGYPPPASFPVAARQSPCDSQEYAYSRASYTNHHDYPTSALIAPPYRHREPEWLRESRRQDEVWEQRHDVRLASQVCTPDRGNAAGPPQALPAQTTATRITAATAKGASDHARIDAGEETARQITPAATPPPARPARSAARTPPPPIPPRSTRPRIDTRNDDARVEVRAWDTTWQEPPHARPPPPPARPPPRPARAAARRPKSPAHIEPPPDAPPYATSARAASPGDADRTAPTNDRPSSSSTSTANTPPTRPDPTTTVPTRSQFLPPRPSRLYGPRAPPADPDHLRKPNKDDVLQDIAYLRAIEEYVQEGGEKKEKARGDEGKDALARSVRGTQLPALQRAHEFSRAFASSRTTGTFPRTITTATNTAGRDKHRAALSALQQGTNRPEQDRAISTPSPPVSSACATTTRKRNDCPNPIFPSHLPPLSLAMPPPPSSARPPLPHGARHETEMHPPCRTATPAMFGTASVTTASHARDATDSTSRPSCPPLSRTALAKHYEQEKRSRSAHVTASRPEATCFDTTGAEPLRPSGNGIKLPTPPPPSYLLPSRPARTKHPTPYFLESPDYNSTSPLRPVRSSIRDRDKDSATDAQSPAQSIRSAPHSRGPTTAHTRLGASARVTAHFVNTDMQEESIGADYAPSPRAPLFPGLLHRGTGGREPERGEEQCRASDTLYPLQSYARDPSTTATHGAFVNTARTAPLLADTRMYKEYTSADSVRLAGAPSVARVVHSAVPAANGGASYADPQRMGELSRARPMAYPTSLDCARTSVSTSATEGVSIDATKHPPPPLPLPSTHQPLHNASPTPPGWPFPISVTEMGWVLAAVVMARNMDREDERRRHEHDDDDYLSMWEPNNQDESDGNVRMDGSTRGPVDNNYHDERNSAATFNPAPTTTLSEHNDTETVTSIGGYADTIAGSASPVPSLATVTSSDCDDAVIQDWDEISARSLDELREFVYDHEEYEQDSDGQVSDKP
ncbi:hypothetical protein EV714DRAFT_266668 [Schizophyllum commune]